MERKYVGEMVRSYEHHQRSQTIDRTRSQDCYSGRSGASGRMMQTALSDANNNIGDEVEQLESSEIITTQTDRCNNPPTTLLDNIDLEFSSSSGNFSITLHQVIGRLDHCFLVD